MRGKLQKALRSDSFGGERVCFRVPSARTTITPAQFSTSAPDGTVWFSAKRVRHAQ